MRRRIAIVVVALTGMMAGPAAISSASAMSVQASNSSVCVSNRMLDHGLCIPRIRL